MPSNWLCSAGLFVIDPGRLVSNYFSGVDRVCARLCASSRQSASRTALRALITDTIPACEYTVYLSAIMANGQRKHITKKIIYSSPDPPVLDSIETTEDEATVSYFPPKEANISFHIEYYPEEHPDYANQINTKASLVRLRGLDSGTPFRIKIWSVYNDVKSTESIESIFRTAGTRLKDGGPVRRPPPPNAADRPFIVEPPIETIAISRPDSLYPVSPPGYYNNSIAIVDNNNNNCSHDNDNSATTSPTVRNNVVFCCSW
ncbi:unnamed protein product [Heligmosomoides polygyrus]|uniref:Fibronectin type-III domain-containing protein n=1 Tax=Heligmosomoides polygyrus TaxID=6339 RepID=A0A3P7YJH8_HELPZ|nr:unnamed protein product [Heligmosomoides polygyrus]